MRASQPALLAAGRVIVELRDQMVVQWADWLGDRMTAAPTIPRPTVEREFLGELLEGLAALPDDSREVRAAAAGDSNAHDRRQRTLPLLVEQCAGCHL